MSLFAYGVERSLSAIFALRSGGNALEQADPSLVESASRGDRVAFEYLARATADRLYPVAARIMRDRDHADEAVQKTLVTIWRELPKLRDPTRFDGWAYRILYRECTAELKRLSHLQGDVHEMKIAGRNVEGTTQVRTRDEIARAFTRLSPEHRAIVVAVYYQGLTGAEAAAALGIPPGTVASRLHYALQTMRAALEADDRSGLAS